VLVGCGGISEKRTSGPFGGRMGKEGVGGRGIGKKAAREGEKGKAEGPQKFQIVKDALGGTPSVLRIRLEEVRGRRESRGGNGSQPLGRRGRRGTPKSPFSTEKTIKIMLPHGAENRP